MTDDDDALTVAWMAGAENARDCMKARIEVLEAENARLREALGQLGASCTCAPAYSSRGMQDPGCPAGDYGDVAREGLGLPPVCQFNWRIIASSKKDT